MEALDAIHSLDELIRGPGEPFTARCRLIPIPGTNPLQFRFYGVGFTDGRPDERFRFRGDAGRFDIAETKRDAQALPHPLSTPDKDNQTTRRHPKTSASSSNKSARTAEFNAGEVKVDISINVNAEFVDAAETPPPLRANVTDATQFIGSSASSASTSRLDTDRAANSRRPLCCTCPDNVDKEHSQDAPSKTSAASKGDDSATCLWTSASQELDSKTATEGEMWSACGSSCESLYTSARTARSSSSAAKPTSETELTAPAFTSTPITTVGQMFSRNGVSNYEPPCLREEITQTSLTPQELSSTAVNSDDPFDDDLCTQTSECGDDGAFVEQVRDHNTSQPGWSSPGLHTAVRHTETLELIAEHDEVCPVSSGGSITVPSLSTAPHDNDDGGQSSQSDSNHSSRSVTDIDLNLGDARSPVVTRSPSNRVSGNSNDLLDVAGPSTHRTDERIARSASSTNAQRSNRIRRTDARITRRESSPSAQRSNDDATVSESSSSEEASAVEDDGQAELDLLELVRRFIAECGPDRVNAEAAVFTTGVVRYLCAELLNETADATTTANRRRLNTTAMRRAIAGDAELSRLLNGVIIPN